MNDFADESYRGPETAGHQKLSVTVVTELWQLYFLLTPTQKYNSSILSITLK